MNSELDRLLKSLVDSGSRTTYSASENFIRAGEVPTKFGFVVQGLFRYYYLTPNAKEFTKVFMPENNMISSYSAMIHGTPSHYYIQALEDSEVIEISFRQWQQLRSDDPRFDKLLIFLLEKGYAVKEKRERELLLLDAEGRYESFLQEHPDLESRLKQHMIASYLGITPIALSRVRKKRRG